MSFCCPAQVSAKSVRHRFLVAAVSLALILPATGLAEVGSAADDRAAIKGADVILAEEGTLRGMVMNSSAQPIAETKVNVLHGQRVVATTTTDANGRFAVKSLRNGTHVIETGETKQVVRLWGRNAAPPAAVEQIAIIDNDREVRGQAGRTPFFTTPVFIGGVAVAGIAIGTVAVIENQNDTPASP